MNRPGFDAPGARSNADVFSRMVIGWQVTTSLYTDLAVDALDMAVWRHRRADADLSGLIHPGLDT
ncbi:hypothetical protein ACWGH3_20275 [Streptomyces sp. NPDC054884]